MARPRHQIATHVDWGLYWARCAADWPDFAEACAWNAAMTAMMIMALEAAGGA